MDSLVQKAVDRLTWISEVLAEIGLVALLLIVLHEVVVRYVFDSPTLHSVELSEYLLVMVVFLSIGWVLKSDRHVAVSFAADLLPKKARLGLNILTSLLTMTFLGILVWKGARTAFTAFTGGYHSSSLLNFPMWIPYSLIPLGALVLSLQYLVKIGGLIRSLGGKE